ncbi:MAG: hypothetical protein EA384_01825 [Spirochaetaceae bacterium]|nr:MAG: hypothetical protein EA384_01825 [Spirochaetaceae bacterium]
MRTIAIVGFSNSGKTTVGAAIVAEACRRGLKAAVIKVGHPTATAQPASSPQPPMRDSDRLAAAGADPAVFRTPAGWQLQLAQPLEDRDQPLHIPAWLNLALAGVDLLVVEGRRVEGAPLVQTVGADGACKVAREQCDLVLENVPYDPLPAHLLNLIGFSAD